MVKNKNHHSLVDNQLKKETAKKKRMFRESMKRKAIEAKEKYPEQRKKVKHMAKVKMKLFYQKIIENMQQNHTENFLK